MYNILTSKGKKLLAHLHSDDE
jgi:hypothetical protein